MYANSQMKPLPCILSMLLLLTFSYKTDAQFNWTISNNWEVTDLTLDPNPDSNCNTTLFRIVNDTLEMGFLWQPGSGCPYEFKQSPVINDTMHLRLSWVENPTCVLWEPIHCFTLKLLPCNGFNDIWIQAHFGLFYNDSIPGTWYHVVKSPPCNIAAAALPIEKLEWQINNNNGLIYWQTEDEKNINYYEIQKSQDAVDFNSIATVYSQGNGSFRYNTAYEPDFTVKYFYRIKTVSIDNKVNFSDVKSDKYARAYAPIHVFPNPAGGNFILISNS